MCIKRIYSDIKQVQQAKLENEGIFCSFDEENLTNVKIMICGPSDTPYEDGFYFFDLKFPTNYPYVPPSVKYETRYRSIRFNPNLYACGKVCVSLLGTWDGPQWDACQSLYSVLLAMQTLLVENPLCNEPGYSKYKPGKHDIYNRLIEFENYRIAILRMVDHPPNGFEAFVPVMQQWIMKRHNRIHKKLTEFAEKEPNPEELTCRVYNFSSYIDYPKILEKFQLLTTQLNSFFPCNVQVEQDKQPQTPVAQSVPTQTVSGTVSDETETKPSESSVSKESTANPTPAPVPTPKPDTNTSTTTSILSQHDIQEVNNALYESAIQQTTQQEGGGKKKRLKRTRPSQKACDHPYKVFNIAQESGAIETFQALPSEYTVNKTEPPVKRTRWLWRRIHPGEQVMNASNQNSAPLLL